MFVFLHRLCASALAIEWKCIGGILSTCHHTFQCTRSSKNDCSMYTCCNIIGHRSHRRRLRYSSPMGVDSKWSWKCNPHGRFRQIFCAQRCFNPGRQVFMYIYTYIHNKTYPSFEHMVKDQYDTIDNKSNYAYATIQLGMSQFGRQSLDPYIMGMCDAFDFLIGLKKFTRFNHKRNFVFIWIMQTTIVHAAAEH